MKQNTDLELLEFWQNEMNFEDTENILRDHFASLYHDLIKSLIVNDDKIMKKFTERTMHESFGRGRVWL